jgi:hypothetical protein
MCTVSMVMDHYGDKWWKYTNPVPAPMPGINSAPFSWPVAPEISRAEFDQLKREVEDMKALLKPAVKYDEEHNQPDCELEEKVAKVREVCKLVGVDIDDVLNASK